MCCHSTNSTLLDAYRAARYEVGVHGNVVVLGVGEPLPAVLEAYLAAKGVAAAAFLSAANPRSKRLTDGQNSHRHAALQAALRHLGLTWLDASGRDVKGQWPAEPSVLALGIGRAQAMGVAEQFEQNAYLEVMRGGSPCLVLTAHWSSPETSRGTSQNR